MQLNELGDGLNRIKKRRSIWYTLAIVIVILGILLARYQVEYKTHVGNYTMVTASEAQLDSARATLITFFSTNASAHATLVLTVFLGLFTIVLSKEKMKRPTIFSYPLYLWVVVLLLTIIEYLSLRLVFWAQMSNDLLSAQPIEYSSAQNLLLALDQGAENTFLHSFTAQFVLYFLTYSGWSILYLTLLGTLTAFIFMLFHVWFQEDTHTP